MRRGTRVDLADRGRATGPGVALRAGAVRSGLALFAVISMLQSCDDAAISQVDRDSPAAATTRLVPTLPTNAAPAAERPPVTTMGSTTVRPPLSLPPPPTPPLTPPPTPATLAVPPPPTPGTPPAASVPGTTDVVIFEAIVSRTCGDTGRGDCFVTLRAAPTPDAEERGRLNEGSSVLVWCQVLGASVRSSVLDAESDVWAVTVNGEYVANIYLDSDALGLFEITVPCP